MDCDLQTACASSSNNHNTNHDQNNVINNSYNNRKLVHVIYYLSRDGRIDHPHLIEGHLLPSQDRLLLKDVKRWLAALRGVGMPDSYAWSYKRIYKSGYIWQDVSGSDALQAVQDRDDEYILLGCHLTHEPFKGGGSCCVSCSKDINVSGVHVRRRLEFTNVGTTCLKDLHDDEEVQDDDEEEEDSSLIRRRNIEYTDTNSNTTTTPKVYKAVCMISPEEAHQQPAMDASTQTGESQRCSTDDQLEKTILTLHPTLNTTLITRKPVSSDSNSNSSAISQLILPPAQMPVPASANREHSNEFTPSSWPSSTSRNFHSKTLSADGLLSTWRLNPRSVDGNLSANSRSPWSAGIGLRQLGSTSPYENSTASSSIAVQKSAASHARAKKQLRQLLLCGLRVDVNESKSFQQQGVQSLTDLQCNKGEINGSDSTLDEYKSWFCSPLAFKLSDVNNSKGGGAAAANAVIDGGGSPIFFRTLASSVSSEAPSLYSSASPTTRSSCLKAVNGEEGEEKQQGSDQAILARQGSRSNEFNVASTHDNNNNTDQKEKDKEEAILAGVDYTTKPNSTSSSSSCSNSNSNSNSHHDNGVVVQLAEKVFNTKISTSVRKHHGDDKKGAGLQYDNIIASRGGKTDYPCHNNNNNNNNNNNGHNKGKSHWRRGLFGTVKKDIKYRCS